ncbi:MAG: YicC family protein [Nitrospinae bacterium]|nr:YicC family protein [Nitrospinota bacterium]
MNSMTGYGISKVETDEYSINLEIKSVNGRFITTNIKAPKLEGSAEFESLISREIKSRFKRGSFDIYFSFGKTNLNQQVVLNEQLAEEYNTAIEKLKTTFSFQEKIGLKELLGFNDIFQKETVAFSYSSMMETLSKNLNEALNGLEEMRKTEGKVIETFFLQQLEEIKKQLVDIESLREKKVDGMKEKLLERVRKMFEDVQYDDNRIIQEVALIIDKSDIQEELTRLRAHVEHFVSFFKENSPGKKLEFLLQEMNREINTIGSKGNDFAIACNVAEVKSLLEAMREQVLNLE